MTENYLHSLSGFLFLPLVFHRIASNSHGTLGFHETQFEKL